jgi:hypothetical protein
VSKSANRQTALTVAKQEAEARFRELIDELRMLTIAFPHLGDSFDADELPISFILERGSRSSSRRTQAAATDRVPPTPSRRVARKRSGRRRRNS